MPEDKEKSKKPSTLTADGLMNEFGISSKTSDRTAGEVVPKERQEKVTAESLISDFGLKKKEDGEESTNISSPTKSPSIEDSSIGTASKVELPSLPSAKTTPQLKNEFTNYLQQNFQYLKQGADGKIKDEALKTLSMAAVNGDASAIKQVHDFVADGIRRAVVSNGSTFYKQGVTSTYKENASMDWRNSTTLIGDTRTMAERAAEKPKELPLPNNVLAQKYALSSKVAQAKKGGKTDIDPKSIAESFEKEYYGNDESRRKELEATKSTDKNGEIVRQNKGYRLESTGLDAMYEYEVAELNQLKEDYDETSPDKSGLDNKIADKVASINAIAEKSKDLYKKYPQVAQQQFNRLIKDKVAQNKTAYVPHFYTSEDDVDEAVKKIAETNPEFPEQFAEQIKQLKSGNLGLFGNELGSQGIIDALRRGTVGTGRDISRWFMSRPDRAAMDVAGQSKASDLPTSFSSSKFNPKIILGTGGKTFIEAKNDLSTSFNNAVNFFGEAAPGLLTFALTQEVGAAAKIGSATTKTAKLAAGLAGEFTEAAAGIKAGQAASMTNNFLQLGERGTAIAGEIDRTVGLVAAQYATTFMKNYDDAYYKYNPQDAKDLGNVKTMAHLYTLSEAMAFKAMGINPNELVKGTLRNSIGKDIYEFIAKEDLSKVTAEQLSEKMYSTWKDKFPAILKSSGVEATKMGGISVMQQAFKDGIDKAFLPDGKGASAEQYVDAFQSGAALGGTFGLLGNLRNYKNISPSTGEVLYNLGTNSDKYHHFIEESVSKGIIPKERANELIKIVNTAKKAAFDASKIMYEDGTPLKDAHKIEISKNNFRDAYLRSLERESDANKEKIDAEREAIKVRNEEILNSSPNEEIEVNVNPETLEVETIKPIKNEEVKTADAKEAEGESTKAKSPESEGQKAIEDKDIIDAAKKVEPFIVDEAAQKEVGDVMNKINDAENINEGELSKAAGHLYELLDKHGGNPSFANLIEPLINKIEGYEFATKTETGTIAESKATGSSNKAKREIKPALEQSAGSEATVRTADGKQVKGTLNVKSGQYVLDVKGGEQIVLGEKAITDRDLKLTSEDKLAEPIEFDENGAVKSVTFETRNGNLVTIENPEKALDIAIQLQADAIGEIPDAAFNPIYEEVSKTVTKEVPKNDIATKEKVAEEGNITDTKKTEQDGKDEKGSQESSQETGEKSSQKNGEENVLSEKSEAAPSKEDASDLDGVGKVSKKMKKLENIVGGITHESNSVRRFKMRMDEYEKVAQTFEQWDKAADDLLKDGYNVEDLIRDVEKTGRATSEIENAVLKKYIATLDAAIEENPTPDLMAKRKRFVLMKDLSNSAAGRALVSLKGFANANPNLADFIQEKMESAGVSHLSEPQIKEQQDKYKELKKTQDEYSEAVEKLKIQSETETADKKLKQSTAGIKKVNKSHQDFVKERESIIKNMREDLLNVAKGGGGAMSSIPGASQLVAIAPHVGKLVRSLAEEGVLKLDEVIDRVFEDIKDVAKVSKKDVRDLIAGVYNEKKGSRGELAEKLSNIKKEAKLLNELDKARLGETGKPNENKQFAKTRRIEELEEKIKEARKLNTEGVEEVSEGKEKTDAQKQKDRQALLQKQIDDIQEKIAKKLYDDTPEDKPPLVLDRRTQQLQDRLIDLKRQRALELARAEESKKSKAAKALDKFWQVLGLKRIIQTAVDFSMPFRQAVITTMNPFKIKTTGEAFKNMFVHTFSPKEFKRFMFRLEESGIKREMNADKMTLSEPDELVMDKRDEEYRTSMLDRLRNSKSPIAQPFKWLLEPVFASERAAASFMNTVRVNEYIKKTDYLKRNGVTRENNPKAYREMSKWIMNSTGRGNMVDFLENSKAGREIAGNTFYGARLMASRFNMLNPFYYAKMPKHVRVEAAKDMAGFVSGLVITGTALAAAGGSISFDPDDPDFMQVRFGDKVYDLTGGMIQYVRTFLRLTKLVGMKADPSSDEDDVKKYAGFTGRSSVKFFTNKFAPNTAYAYHFLTGKGGDGKDFNPAEILQYYPMYVDDLKQGIEEDGASALFTILVPNLFGMGVQQYDKK